MVHRKEFVGELKTSSTVGEFQLTKYECNPGLPDSFRWVSPIANSFETYEILQLEYLFVSTSASALNSTDTNLGKVAARFVTNVYAPVDTNRFQMENGHGAHSSVTSTSFRYNVVVERSNPPRLVRNSDTFSGDKRLYDAGYMEFATFGQQGTDTVIGEIWMQYTLRLMKPLYIQGMIGSTVLSNQTNGDGTWLNASPFGTSATAFTVMAPSSFTMKWISGTVMEFPENFTNGLYLMQYYIKGSVVTGVNPVPLGINECYALRFANTGFKSKSCTGSSSSCFLVDFIIWIHNNGGPRPRIQLTGGTQPASVTTAHVQLLQLDYDYLGKVDRDNFATQNTLFE